MPCTWPCLCMHILPALPASLAPLAGTASAAPAATSPSLWSARCTGSASRGSSGAQMQVCTVGPQSIVSPASPKTGNWRCWLLEGAGADSPLLRPCMQLQAAGAHGTASRGGVHWCAPARRSASGRPACYRTARLGRLSCTWSGSGFFRIHAAGAASLGTTISRRQA